MELMDNSLILGEKKLSKIPPGFVLVLVLILGLPVIFLNYFGLDFSTIAKDLGYENSISSFVIESQIRGYFRQTILQWSAFSLSAITVLLAFTQYRLTNDKIALIIGLAVLFSGTVEALHTWVIDGLSPNYLAKSNLDAVIWTFSNTMSGIILLVGLVLLLRKENPKNVRVVTCVLLSIFLILAAITLIYYAASLSIFPQMWYENTLLSRPYELSYVLVYLIIILFVYPKVYRSHPYILANCIFYISVTEVVMAIYLMLLSNTPYDSAFNIAYFLKIIVYFIPFSCLIINYVFSYNEVIEAQRRLQISENKLKFLASHDTLTNLYNRREFENLLNITIANSARNNAYFALFVIDIDNFKSINDTVGHIDGDSYLKQFAEHLSLLTRKGDILSRIGGDEFALISSRLKTPSSARILAERIKNGMVIPYMVQQKSLTSTVSIGISIYPIDGTNSELLLKNADIAMYSAKRAGKNTYQFYTTKLSYLQHREAEIVSYLRSALKNDEFYLYYQPKYNLLTREIVGAEVLLRWYNETLGNVLPEEFIPIAENSGLIINIGNWVINKTFEQASLWAEKYKRRMLFSINVSPVQFANTNFFSNLKTSLEKWDYPAEYLDIEITENLLMQNNADITVGLKNIDLIGVNISIDDFGTGYSSLSRLKSLPINTLKIDKIFVADIQNEFDKVVVIDTIIKLAHELGMNIVAEGIETNEQLAYLVSKKCHLGQGFLLSKPLNAADFARIAYEDAPLIAD